MKKIFCLLAALALTFTLARAEGGLRDFSTTDMEGHEITQEIFADYDLTVVNLWVTWCGYCIEEIPGFAELKTMLPENVNFITICADASENMDLAKEILRASGANFQTLVPDENLEAQLASQTYSYPTTFFLNERGESVADPLVGALFGKDSASGYYGIITGVLHMMEK